MNKENFGRTHKLCLHLFRRYVWREREKTKKIEQTKGRKRNVVLASIIFLSHTDRSFPHFHKESTDASDQIIF